MNKAGVVALALLTLPFYLLPAIAAFMNRKRAVAFYLFLNILIALLLPFGLGGVLFASGGFESPMIGVFPLAIIVILWLILLHFGIRPDAPEPDEVDEPVTLVEHDESWRDAFATESRRIAETLSLPEGAIEHIGSTAVPGLAAKPVVDMMLGVDHYPPTVDLLSRLVILGYQNMGEAGVPDRTYLRLRGGERDFNLHVVERGREHWQNNLALRELLRGDPDRRSRYLSGKIQALETGGARLKSYSAAKHAVVTELLAAARESKTKSAG